MSEEPSANVSGRGAAGGLTKAAELAAVYGPAAIILTLPLEFTAMLFRQQLSRFVMIAVAIAFAYLVVTGRRRIEVPWRLSSLILVVLIVASVIGWLLTRAPGSRNSLLDILLYPFLLVLLTSTITTEADQRRSWIAFLVSGLGVAVLGFFLYVAHLHIWTPNPVVASRLNITFADPNITARFLTLAACAGVMLFAERKAPAWLTISTAIACAVVLPMTYSRSGLALFIVGVVIAAVLAFHHRRAAALGAIVLVVFALSTGVNPDTRMRAGEAVDTLTSLLPGDHASSAGGATSGGASSDSSAFSDNRKYLIAAGMKMFVDHPVAGVGFGGYEHALLTTYRRFLPQGYTDSVSHTALVTVLAEQGVIGVVLLIAFLVVLALEAWTFRMARAPAAVWGTVAATLIVPIFLYSQFEARFLQEPYLWWSLALFYAAVRLGEVQHARDEAGTGPAPVPAPPGRRIEAA